MVTNHFLYFPKTWTALRSVTTQVVGYFFNRYINWGFLILGLSLSGMATNCIVGIFIKLLAKYFINPHPSRDHIFPFFFLSNPLHSLIIGPAPSPLKSTTSGHHLPPSSHRFPASSLEASLKLLDAYAIFLKVKTELSSQISLWDPLGFVIIWLSW